MTAIGFHYAPAGDMRGIGEYLRELDASGTPFLVKGVDDHGLIEESWQYTNAKHIRIYRMSTTGQGDGNQYDVPDYSLDPEDAALDHWNKTVANLPPEFRKDNTWIEVVNEIDKNQEEFMGKFAGHISRMANDDGYKIMLFGWASGEPEESFWRNPHTQDFLRYCASNRDRCAIALHEYSYVTDDIWRMYPYLIGRYQTLNKVCDESGISRPDIYMTEWGWAERNIPDVDKAMSDLLGVHDLYQSEGNIKGMAIWQLGGGWGDLTYQVQRLIEPVTEVAPEVVLNTPTPTPPPSQGVRGEPRVDYPRTFNLIHSSVSQDDAVGVFLDGFSNGRTIGLSADDAGIGNLSVRNVVFYHDNQPPSVIEEYRAWFDKHYSGVSFSEENISKGNTGGGDIGVGDSDVAFGLHADARGGTVSSAEVSAFQRARIESVKILSSHSPETINLLKSSLPSLKPWVVRAFLSFGGRRITPQQFYNDTYSDVERAINTIGREDTVIEIHNEPNLSSEGLGSSWNTAQEFNEWYLQVIGFFRERFPRYKLMFPAMSPQAADFNNGVVYGQASDPWWSACASSIDDSDLVANHVYWSNPVYPLSGSNPFGGYALLDRQLAQARGKGVWITEASNNQPDSDSVKSSEYISFWKYCTNRTQVKGIHYFVASAHEDTFPEETWVGSTIPERVSNR